MGTFSRPKTIILGMIGIVLLAGIAIVLYTITPKATPEPPKSEVSLTDTPDFNACKVTTTDIIKHAPYGDTIKTMTEGLRVGAHAPNGTTADGCGYNFTTSKSNTNKLLVEVYVYTPTLQGNDKETVDASWSQISGSHPVAYFGKDFTSDTIIYKLRVIPGAKNVLFELDQPTDAVAIDEPSALDFLVGIAAKANLDVINPATN